MVLTALRHSHQPDTILQCQLRIPGWVQSHLRLTKILQDGETTCVAVVSTSQNPNTTLNGRNGHISRSSLATSMRGPVLGRSISSSHHMAASYLLTSTREARHTWCSGKLAFTTCSPRLTSTQSTSKCGYLESKGQVHLSRGQKISRQSHFDGKGL
jgi:hypothetical protein